MAGRSYALLIKNLLKHDYESLVEYLLYLFIMYLSIILFFIMNDIVTRKRTLTITELNSYFPSNWIISFSIIIIIWFTTKTMFSLGDKLKKRHKILPHFILFLYLFLLTFLFRVFPIPL